MNKMHNLGTVISFEVVRMLKKFSFWAMALGFPILFGLIFGVIALSNKATSDAADKLKDKEFSVAITDESKLVNPEVAGRLKIKSIAQKSEGMEMVRSGKLDGYIYIPSDITKHKVEIYGKDVGMFENGRYSSVAENLLSVSVSAQTTEQQRLILQGKLNTSLTTYRDGRQRDLFKEMIAPGFFLVMFYVLISFFGNQMLNTTIEEKENRTVEMLLTTLNAKTLIIGKILAMMVLSLLQMLIVLLPAIVMYLLLKDNLHLPNFDLSTLVFDPLSIGLAAAIFVSAYALFTGLLVAVGAMMPTAKEAASWFTVVLLLMFGPLYGAPAFVSSPDSLFVQIVSYFPLTSPIPLLLRNAVGNLQLHEALIGISILAISAALVIPIAVKLFRYGSMQYDSKLSFSVLRAKRSKQA